MLMEGSLTGGGKYTVQYADHVSENYIILLANVT